MRNPCIHAIDVEIKFLYKYIGYIMRGFGAKRHRALTLEQASGAGGREPQSINTRALSRGIHSDK